MRCDYGELFRQTRHDCVVLEPVLREPMDQDDGRPLTSTNIVKCDPIHPRGLGSEYLALCFAKILCALKIAIPCRDGCPILIPSPSSAKNLSLGTPSGIPVYMRMEEPGRFHDATSVRIRQPDRTGGAALPVVREKGRGLRLWCEFFRLAFPSRVRDVCGPRGSSEYTQRGDVSGGVRQLQ
jgi:hypothetical protein